MKNTLIESRWRWCPMSAVAALRPSSLAMTVLTISLVLGAPAFCFAQPSALAGKLVQGSPWTVSATIPGFTPFKWTFRLSADGKLERRTAGEWREVEVGTDGTVSITGRDGNVYSIRIETNGELTLDRTNLRRGAQVSMQPEK